MTAKTDLLRWCRWLAVPLAVVLIAVSVGQWWAPHYPPEWFFRMRGVLECILAVLLVLPYQALGRRGSGLWWKSFLLLVAVSVLFVFGRVIGVLFEARETAMEGERMGLPAGSGTLIFLVLLQLPVVLFLRYPEELD